MNTVVVVGASLAGLRATEALRSEGYDGRLVLVGAEPHLPYDRPPLSKGLLAGLLEPEQIALRRGPYEELDVELRLGVRAGSLDVAAGEVTLADGTALAFDGLVIATGSAPRTLPGTPELPGIHVLRTIDDALALRAQLDAEPKVVVVGAGFIGSEVAATCRGRGLDVTVVEALSAPLVRGLGPVLGAACAGLHRDHGVDLRLGVGVERITGAAGVEAVHLVDGSVIPADVVVVGIGVAPVTEWLEGSGLTLDNGVVCDETCLAAPGIVAAGDVARWPNREFGGRLMRLEHWTNAGDQGPAAARRLLHGDGASPAPYAPVPYVWSDQYDRKIQTVGDFSADDEIEVVLGALDERRFTAIAGRDGRLVGALGFSMPKHVMAYLRMIMAHGSFEDARAYARQVG